MSNLPCKFTYRAVAKQVYDVDTITDADVDLGFGVWLNHQHFRLLGINTPEMRGATKDRAVAARDALRELILGKEITIRTHRDSKEKFGRWLAEVFVKQPDGTELNVNQYMIEEGYAVPFMVS